MLGVPAAVPHPRYRVRAGADADAAEVKRAPADEAAVYKPLFV